MSNAFLNSKWIWQNNKDNADEYVQFVDLFQVENVDEVFMNISADSNYTVWVNEKLVSFGQYSDYPHYKVYDSFELSEFLVLGDNKLAVICWYYGKDSQVYFKNKAGLLYEVIQNKKILAKSDENVRCRIATDYANHTCENITPQLGFNYHYDMSKYDGWNNIDFKVDKTFENAVVVPNMPQSLYIRPVKRLVLENRTDAKIISQGSFVFGDGERKSEKMLTSGLYFEEFFQISGQKENDLLKNKITLKSNKNEGIYFIVDLGREECGFLDIELSVKEKTQIDIAYGEHIADGRVRSAIGVRNFNCSFLAKQGMQQYLNTFRRLGLRYLQFFVHSKEVTILYAGVRPTSYPLTIEKYEWNNRLRNDIYETSLRTLQLCMHEHYEDCPWREQALYTMDSRNQMLCGYDAFREFEFAKANLELISYGKREDGLLPMCSPAGVDFPIPFFSLIYIVQMNEYAQVSSDNSLLIKHYGVLKGILNVFIQKQKANDLVDNFEDKTYWNFYEWETGLDGYYLDENGGLKQDNRASFDAALNAFFAIALEHMTQICKAIHHADYTLYKNLLDNLNLAIFNAFYDENMGLFYSYIGKIEGHYSVLVNSLCVLCGACPDDLREEVCEKIINKQDEMVSNTLSMNVFVYDALLKTNKAKYAPYILNEIDNTYGYMLKNGATTFWETIKGAADFGGAGSLCHGWSAIPVYYYHLLKEFM